MGTYRMLCCGPSGTGKTTIAKWLSEELGIPFIDGSRTTLLPGDRGKTHRDMLDKLTPTDFTHKNYQIVSNRYNMFRNIEGSFICDRSLIDPIAYQIFETAKDLPQCDFDHLISTVNTCHLDLGITHYIYFPYSLSSSLNCPIEDNNKRITNPYFQLMITDCFNRVIDVMGRRTGIHPKIFVMEKDWDGSFKERRFNRCEQEIPLITLSEWDNELRKEDLSLRFYGGGKKT